MNYTYMVFVLSLVGVLVGGSMAVATDNADGLYADKTDGLYTDKTDGLYTDKTDGLYTDKTDGLFEGNPFLIDGFSPDE